MSLKDKVSHFLNEAELDIINAFFRSEVSDDIAWDDDAVAEFRKGLSDARIRFEHVDYYGGEDQGKEYWSVYLFNNDDEAVYVKFNGWYASYHGSEFEEWFFVEARQVEVTRFIRVE